MIATTPLLRDRPHRVRFEMPGPPLPDGDGGWISQWVALTPPEMFVEIRPLTAMDFERGAPGALLAIATHVVSGPFHPQLTTKCRVVFGVRHFDIESVANREERSIDMVLLCKEVTA